MKQFNVAAAVTRTPICKICHRIGKLTNEDILPIWYRKYYLKRVGPFSPGRSPRRLTIRVCEMCNSTMGRKFENDAAALMLPLIRGDEVTLSVANQVRIAAWITKTGLLGSLASLRPGEWGFTLAGEMLRSLIDSGLPPTQTAVRIARPAASTEVERSFLPLEVIPRISFYSMNVTMNLYWEMFVGPTASIMQYVDWCRANPEEAFVNIWPPAEPVDWPSEDAVTMGEVAAMRDLVLLSRQPGVPLADPWRRVWLPPASLEQE